MILREKRTKLSSLQHIFKHYTFIVLPLPGNYVDKEKESKCYYDNFDTLLDLYEANISDSDDNNSEEE